MNSSDARVHDVEKIANVCIVHRAPVVHVISLSHHTPAFNQQQDRMWVEVDMIVIAGGLTLHRKGG